MGSQTPALGLYYFGLQIISGSRSTMDSRVELWRSMGDLNLSGICPVAPKECPPTPYPVL